MRLVKLLKHLFLPQRSNNYHAKILQPSFMALFVFIFLVNQTLINFFALLKPGVLGYSSNITPEKIIELTNNERTVKGLGSLSVNPLLNEAAQRKAGDMFAFDYWAHKSPSGREPWSFLKEVGYSYKVAGENLARDFSDPDSVVKAWIASPLHRENLLNSKFKEIGVAVVDGTLGGMQTTLVVQFFGAPTAVSVPKKEAPKVEYQPVRQVVAEKEVEKEIASADLVPVSVLSDRQKTLISPYVLNKTVSFLFFAVVAFTLAIDAYLVYKKKVYRSAGKTTAHAGFLLIMFLLILLSKGPGLIN